MSATQQVQQAVAQGAVASAPPTAAADTRSWAGVAAKDAHVKINMRAKANTAAKIDAPAKVDTPGIVETLSKVDAASKVVDTPVKVNTPPFQRELNGNQRRKAGKQLKAQTSLLASTEAGSSDDAKIRSKQGHCPPGPSSTMHTQVELDNGVHHTTHSILAETASIVGASLAESSDVTVLSKLPLDVEDGHDNTVVSLNNRPRVALPPVRQGTQGEPSISAHNTVHEVPAETATQSSSQIGNIYQENLLDDSKSKKKARNKRKNERRKNKKQAEKMAEEQEAALLLSAQDSTLIAAAAQALAIDQAIKKAESQEPESKKPKLKKYEPRETKQDIPRKEDPPNTVRSPEPDCFMYKNGVNAKFDPPTVRIASVKDGATPSLAQKSSTKASPKAVTPARAKSNSPPSSSTFEPSWLVRPKEYSFDLPIKEITQAPRFPGGRSHASSPEGQVPIETTKFKVPQTFNFTQPLPTPLNNLDFDSPPQNTAGPIHQPGQRVSDRKNAPSASNDVPQGQSEQLPASIPAIAASTSNLFPVPLEPEGSKPAVPEQGLFALRAKPGTTDFDQDQVDIDNTSLEVANNPETPEDHGKFDLTALCEEVAAAFVGQVEGSGSYLANEYLFMDGAFPNVREEFNIRRNVLFFLSEQTDVDFNVVEDFNIRRNVLFFLSEQTDIEYPNYMADAQIMESSISDVDTIVDSVEDVLSKRVNVDPDVPGEFNIRENVFFFLSKQPDVEYPNYMVNAQVTETSTSDVGQIIASAEDVLSEQAHTGADILDEFNIRKNVLFFLSNHSDVGYPNGRVSARVTQASTFNAGHIVGPIEDATSMVTTTDSVVQSASIFDTAQADITSTDDGANEQRFEDLSLNLNLKLPSEDLPAHALQAYEYPEDTRPNDPTMPQNRPDTTKEVSGGVMPKFSASTIVSPSQENVSDIKDTKSQQYDGEALRVVAKDGDRFRHARNTSAVSTVSMSNSEGLKSVSSVTSMNTDPEYPSSDPAQDSKADDEASVLSFHSSPARFHEASSSSKSDLSTDLTNMDGTESGTKRNANVILYDPEMASKTLRRATNSLRTTERRSSSLQNKGIETRELKRYFGPTPPWLGKHGVEAAKAAATVAIIPADLTIQATLVPVKVAKTGYLVGRWACARFGPRWLQWLVGP